MATSLARQLQAIRSDVVATLDKKKHEKVSSLLFDPAEAALRDYDEVLSLGLDGLNKLIEVEPRFKKFKANLFSSSSKDVDRAIQTKTENDAWDNLVNDFLDLLGPYCLSIEAAGALEWLIRRFKIHLFPVTAETLLLTLLPYHSEEIFARAVQIVSLPGKFSFLSSYNDIRTAAQFPPVPRQLLVRGLLSKDNLFLDSYFTFVVTRIKSGHGYPEMILLWTRLSAETILQMRESRIPEEVVVARIMPFVAQGLQMKNDADFQVASYTILSILASNRSLSDIVVEAAMNAICQGWTEKTRSSGLICLMALAKAQGEKAVSDSVVDSILAIKDLASIVEFLPSKAPGGVLFLPVVKKLLGSSKLSEEDVELLIKITFSKSLSLLELETVMQDGVLTFLKSKKKKNGPLEKWLLSCVREKQEDFKRAMEPLLETLRTGEIEHLEALAQIQLRPDSGKMAIDEPNGENQVTDKSGIDWSTLPAELSHPSFFTFDGEHTMVTDAFVEIVNTFNSQGFDKLMAVTNFTQSVASFPSLLSRVWLSISLSEAVRVAALQQFSQYLTTCPPTIDFQGFLPHVIAALSDPSKDVRNASADAFKAMTERYGPGSGPDTVAGLIDLYPDSNGLKWLSSAEAKSLGQTISPKLGECKLDPNYIVTLFGGILNAAGKKNKKEHNATSLMVFLSSHVVCCGMTSLQYSLLRILNCHLIDSAPAIKLRVQSLQPLLERCKDVAFVTNLANQEPRLDSEEIKSMLVEIIGVGASASQISLLLDLVATHGPLSVPACRQLSVIFFAAATPTQLQIANLLLSQLESESSAIAKAASTALNMIDLPTSTILSLFESVQLEIDSRDSSPARKRQRTDSARSSPGVLSDSVGQSVQRVTQLLEVLERQNLEQHVPIIPPLFGILDQLLAVESDTRTSLNYPKQLVLSCLISIVKALTTSGDVPEPNMFRIDSLIGCIRTSASPQVHNRALLLLAALAQVVPDLILRHVMPIFTFMGANVLRQDDEYSAHVIQQTIKSVVPLLTNSVHLDKGTTPIISAFVVNFDFIPKHRRLSLFKTLVEALGPEQHMHLALMSLGEKCCQDKERNKTTLTEFAVDLVNSFSLETRLIAVDLFLKLTISIPHDPSQEADGFPLDIMSYSQEKLRSFERQCLNIISMVLSSKSFQGAVNRAFAAGYDVSSDNFSSVVEKLLHVSAQSKKEELVSTALDGILSGLPLQFVSDIVQNFLDTKKSNMTAQMISIATDRFTKPNKGDTTAITSVTQFLSLLNAIIQNGEVPSTTAVALECVARLSQVHGKANLDAFEKILPIIVEGGLKNENDVVVLRSLRCLLSMLRVLGPRIVSLLPDITGVIFDKFNEYTAFQTELLSFLEALNERIPSFMTPYVSKSFQLLFDSSSRTSQKEDLQQVKEHFVRTVTSNIPTDVCVDSLSTQWQHIHHKDKKSLEMSILVVDLIITHGSREDLIASSAQLFDLFLQLFDIRNETALKPKVTKKLELKVIDAFMKLVMKLNDSTFRPFFVTLKDWAFRSTTGERKINREIFFYEFINKFLDVLQSVVTAYYGIILEDTVHILEDFGEGTLESKPLWTSLIHSLHKSFTFDIGEDAYWSSPIRFDKLVTPLLSQLTLTRFKSAVVIPAIVGLASRARSEDNFRVINNQLMEYMKSENAALRLASIDAQRELYTALAGDWAKVLPPTVPAISEAMEDEDDNVIEAVHRLIATIQEVTGISIQKLLT